jgi:hypothetical protein
MKSFNVIFVFTSIHDVRIDSDNTEQLKNYLRSEYGIDDEYYGPISEKIFGIIKQKIENGEFYVTCHIRGVNPQHPDEIAE